MAPGIESSENGNMSESVPHSHDAGNIHSRWNGEIPIAGTATTEVKNSIAVFTVCLVTPEPERMYVRMPSIQPNVTAAATSHTRNPIKVRNIFTSP
jgi:hypothetical protein